MIKKIIHTFETTQDSPLDSRNVVDNLTNLNTILPLEIRYKGLMVWINSENNYYCFPYDDLTICKPLFEYLTEKNNSTNKQKSTTYLLPNNFSIINKNDAENQTSKQNNYQIYTLDLKIIDINYVSDNLIYSLCAEDILIESVIDLFFITGDNQYRLNNFELKDNKIIFISNVKLIGNFKTKCYVKEN